MDKKDKKSKKNEKHPPILVFDLDGTLINSMDFVDACCAATLSEHLSDPISREEFKRRFASRHHCMFSELGVKDPKIMEKVWLKWLDEDIKRLPAFSLFQGVSEMLSGLEDLGAHLYLWTAREGGTAHQILERLGLHQRFRDIRFGDYGEIKATAHINFDPSKKAKSKPNPEALMQMLAPYPELSLDRVYMVGDSVNDVEGAKNFGCLSIGATWCSSASHEALLKAGANFMAHTPSECLNIIKNQCFN